MEPLLDLSHRVHREDDTDVEKFMLVYRKTVWEPECALLLGVLERAYEDYSKGEADLVRLSARCTPGGFDTAKKRNTCRHCGETNYDCAKKWLFEDASDEAFSFNNICEALGLSPTATRKALKHLRLLGVRKIGGGRGAVVEEDKAA